MEKSIDTLLFIAERASSLHALLEREVISLDRGSLGREIVDMAAKISEDLSILRLILLDVIIEEKLTMAKRIDGFDPSLSERGACP